MKSIFKNNIKKLFSYFLLLSTILILGCDKEVSRSPVESEAPQGFIYINSIPDGFTIYQNGRNTGRITPDSISYIEAGNYEITLKKKYFKDTSLVVIVGVDEKVNVLADIVSNPSMYGSFTLNTAPTGADIILNDSLTGRITPTTFSGLLPGEYRVKFQLFNHRDKELIAIVRSNRSFNYYEELRDTSIWVDYELSNSGIQSNTLNSVAIDHMNVKWIGTMDVGLIRFDEVSFTNYSTTNSSIPSDFINCVSVDEQNRIWVGTDKGIGVLAGNSWQIYDVNNSGLTANYVNMIRFDNLGNTWIGTSSNLIKFDGFNWTVYNNPLGRDWIEDFYIEEQNKIWLGTILNGIYILQDGTYQEVQRILYNYPTYSISSMAMDNSAKLWFCFVPDTSGRGGISYLNTNNFTNFFIGTSQNYPKEIFIDNESNKWISTNEGLFKFNAQDNFIVFTTSNSLITSNNVSASVRDVNGNVWITTIGGGLNKYKP